MKKYLSSSSPSTSVTSLPTHHNYKQHRPMQQDQAQAHKQQETVGAAAQQLGLDDITSHPT